MNCPRCGIENPVEASFCMACGTNLAVSKSPVFSDPIETATSSGFVGRNEEMRELMSSLGAVLSGKGRLVMLAGEPGIGKTRIAQELAAEAEIRGAQILWGRCYDGEGAPPYWPWIKPLQSFMAQSSDEELRRDLGPGAAEIAGILNELRDRFPDLEAPAILDPEQARFRLFNSLSTFFKNAANRQPIVLVLDDLHWADSASLLLLEFVAQDLLSFPMLVLGTYRDVEVNRRHPLSRTLGVLVREREFSRLQIRGLDRDAVEEILRLASGNDPSDTMVEAVLGRTEGNPLFVGEISRIMLKEGDQGLTRIPEGVKDAIGWRLNRLTEECNEMLTVASVIGREFNHDQLTLLLGAAARERLIVPLEEAITSGVIEELPLAVGRYQFTHALIQETLAGELTMTRRARLHAQIAEALEIVYEADAESHAAELAHHFAEAETVLGIEKLVHYSLMAGEQALATYAYEEALAHFSRALAGKEGQNLDADRARILFGLGRAQGATLPRGRLQEAVVSLSQAFEYYESSGDVDRAIAVAQAYPVPPVARVREVTSLIERALALVTPESYDAGRLLPRYGNAKGVMEGDYGAAQQAFDRALAIARQEKDIALEVRTLVDASRVDGFHLRWQQSLEKSAGAIDLLDQVDDPASEVPAHFWAASASLISGDLESARDYASGTLDAAERLRHTYWMAVALWTNAAIAKVSGDWESTRDFVGRGTNVDPQEMVFLGTGAIVEAEAGDLSRAYIYRDQMLDLMQRNPPGFGESPQAAMAIPMVARISGVEHGLEVALAIAESILMHSQVPMFSAIARSCLALTAIIRGDGPAAKEQYDALKSVRFAEWYGCMATDRLLGLLAHTAGDLDQASEHFNDALAFCRKGFRPELAWSCCDYADTLLQRGNAGDREKAISLLDESLAIATELGMRPLGERVVSRQAKVQSQPIRPPLYPDGLTQREAEVLRLIAAGKNNREISEELMISLGTVANHVTSILNKTGSNNRTEAAGYAIRQGLLG